jgi:hypothetical protein
MSYASIALGLARFAFGLKSFLREPVSVEAARAIVQQRMASRERSLLALIERAVFANSRSPYLALFRAAGCEQGDAARLIRLEGTEGALQKLLEAGVYVTFSEFKGRAPAVRGSRTFRFRAEDFDNRLLKPSYQISSGGSTGQPSRLLIDLDYLTERTPHWALWFAANHLLACSLVFATAYYPGIVNRQLICARFGKRFVKWFTTAGGGTPAYRLATAYVHSLARWAAGFPRPERVRLSDTREIGEYLAGLAREGAAPCVVITPTTAARVCLAMQRPEDTLAGVCFLLGAEPLTHARRETIEAVGARAIVSYGTSEAGTIGSQCPNPTAPDDVHVALDSFALLGRPLVSGDGGSVEALVLTGFTLSAPKVLLNAEIGDYAARQRRCCGCTFDELGLNEHLHTIRSFEKLTGDGVTFLGADLLHVLEDVLPRRFGGSLVDYQLVESQDARGLPNYILLVSPEIGPVDEEEMITTFLQQLANSRQAYGFMANQWAEAGMLRVERQRPVATAFGKVLPFRTLGPDG